MIKGRIIHPGILRGLAEAGHGARILLADGNYPVTVKSNPAARIVHLNFVPGVIGGVEIVGALAEAIVVESATYMLPPDESEPEIVGEYRALIGGGVPFAGVDRFAFYDEARGGNVSLVIASGERRVYANLLLTVGVRSD